MLGLIRILMVAAGTIAAGAAFAQVPNAPAYPNRPIRLVVPFVPGGTNDIIARTVGEKLTERLGQAFIVDNRGGANGVIGCEIVARSNPDGYTLIIAGAGFAVNPSLRSKLPFDSERDFAPISMVVGGPYLMVVHPSVPAKTVGEFVAWAKSRAGKVNFASVGSGSPPHLAAVLLMMVTGIEMQHIPYKGGAAVLPDLISGRVDMFFGSISTLHSQIQAGKIRPIAVTTLQRSGAMPELPTFIESGLAGFEVNGWYGLLAPGKTSPGIVSRLNAELRQVLAEPNTREYLLKQGMDPAPGTPAEFAQIIRSEIVKWGKVVKAAGLQPD